MEHKVQEAVLKVAPDSGRVSAAFASFGVIDKDGDITEPGAFGRQTAHLLPMHVWKDADTPFIGVAKIREEGGRAVADIELNLELQRAKDWRSSLKFAMDRGKTIEWSYGFDVDDFENTTRNGRRVRILKKLTVHEVSPVVIGAGEATQTLSIKQCASCSGEVTLEEQVGLIEKHAANVVSRIDAIGRLRFERNGKSLNRSHRQKLRGIIADAERLLSKIPDEPSEIDLNAEYMKFLAFETQRRLRAVGLEV